MDDAIFNDLLKSTKDMVKHARGEAIQGVTVNEDTKYVGKKMDRLTELMVITMEECGELTQACSKVVRKQDFEKRKWMRKEVLEESKKELTKEVADVLCMIELLEEEGLVNSVDLAEGINSKRRKLATWSGLVTEQPLGEPRRWQDIILDE